MRQLLMLDKDDTLVQSFPGEDGLEIQLIQGIMPFIIEQAKVRDCIVVTMGSNAGEKHVERLMNSMKGYYGAEAFKSDQGRIHLNSANTHLRSNPEAKRIIDSIKRDYRGFVKDLEFVKKKHDRENHENINAVMIGNEPDIYFTLTDPTTPLIVVDPYSFWPTRENTRTLLATLYAGTTTALTFDELHTAGIPTSPSHDLVTDSVVTTVEGIPFRLSRNPQLGIRVIEERFTEGRKIQPA